MASFPGQKSAGAPLPNQVVGLNANTVSTTEIDLSWTAVSPAPLNYNVYRNGGLVNSAPGGTIFLQEDFTSYPTGNVALTSAWTGNGYVDFENSGIPANLQVQDRSILPAGLISDRNFPAGKTRALFVNLSNTEIIERLVWGNYPANTGRTLSHSEWQYRGVSQIGGEKAIRDGNFVGGVINAARLVDSIWTLGQLTGLTLIANSTNMFPYGDHGFGQVTSPWPPGLIHVESVMTLSTGTNSDGSAAFYVNGVLVALATGLRFFKNVGDDAFGWQASDIGEWSSTGGGTEGPVTYPIPLYICAARLADSRQGVWPMSNFGTTVFNDTGLQPATTYSYAVQAVNSNGAGVMSAPVSATTLPAQVTGLTATALSSNSIGTAWTATPGASTYTVKRGGSVVGTPATNAFTDTGLTPSTSYTYTVAANGAGGQGAFSSPASATTQAASGSVLFAPGFFGVFDYAGGITSSHFTNGDSGIISGLTTDPALGSPTDNLTGIAFIATWRSLDTGTSAPTYNFALIDQYANAVKAKNKYWALWINWSDFAANTSNASVTTGAKCVPDWLTTQQGIFNTTANYKRSDLSPPSAPGAGVFSKMYNSPVANAYLALIQAIAAHYASDPNFWGIVHGIGTANSSFNGVDTLGTKQPQVNYNSDYTDTGMINWLSNLIVGARSALGNKNFYCTVDYLFNMAGSSSYSGQDVQWTNLFNTAVANKVIFGSVDSWTKPWINPQNPFSSTGQNAYIASTNASYSRSLYADQIFRGWRGPTPGVGTGFRSSMVYAGSMELTEMGGYIGQFALSDIMGYRGATCDNVQYMFVDINYAQSGNYGLNKSPNTLWLASTSYDTTFGQSVYRFIQGAGALNTANPYA